MFTCNKNFVDWTVWILKSWTCIKLNIKLHRCLKERERERGDGAVDRTAKSSPMHTPLEWTGPDRMGLHDPVLFEIRTWTRWDQPNSNPLNFNLLNSQCVSLTLPHTPECVFMAPSDGNIIRNTHLAQIQLHVFGLEQNLAKRRVKLEPLEDTWRV